ncbi:mannose-6-phosphate isomerase [Deinococcus metalli]|uniref:Mannose-6-phosphate isomerase n=1 Tax=Deinococcus metalli TaxID=1141878 RepID=A0A7W8KH69_9DEIO|nr:type I phosphomannose isomerase catalytic subunit [Deinococcus metalli]MBB5376936.1 mannose-6-phosphate isomerase [Deinococcus metalli]GHF46429.1 mannose-6-phosphate isomerase [Deinococcus metalli]
MTAPDALPAFLPLTPRYYPRVWGGDLLAPPAADGTPIGEAWIADGQSVVASGPLAGQSVAQIMAAHPDALLGDGLDASAGFPLLIKLLDCRDWLSVQVHPNDEQAREMVGPGERGKTEAWHILRAAPDAELLAGVVPGTAPDALAAAIRHGHDILDLSQRRQVVAGDTIFIPAGTLHALGPGLLLYEVQQASDTTYRVYDWDRPASAGRKLHLEESVRVTDPHAQGDFRAAHDTLGLGELVSCEYFTLRGVPGEQAQDTAGRVQIVTTVEGTLTLEAGLNSLELPQYATAVVPASTGLYHLNGEGRALVARPG